MKGALKIGLTDAASVVADAREVSSARVIEGFFVRNRKRFVYLHLLMTGLFLLFIVAPAFLPLPSEEDGIFKDFSRFSGFVIWGLWFPLVFLSVIAFGRLWCGLLCPQGFLSEYVSRRALNIKVPAWMRWGGVPVLSFIVVTVFGQIAGVRDYPLAAMEVFTVTTALAVLTGILFARNRRVWCRHLCPVGPLLGIFSRLGCVSFERNGASSSSRAYPCPTFINTSLKKASSNCIECFRCVNPGDSGSLRLEFRRPGSEIERIGIKEPNLWEVLFLFSATGLSLGAFHYQANPMYTRFKQALGEFFLERGLSGIIGKTGPWWVMVNYPARGEVFNILDCIAIATFMLISMIAVALILFSLTFLPALMMRKDEPLLKTVTEKGYLYAPVALVSLVAGLGLVLFQSLGGATGKDAVNSILAVFLAGGAFWSAYLWVRAEGVSARIIPAFLGIGAIGLLWQMVLF